MTIEFILKLMIAIAIVLMLFRLLFKKLLFNHRRLSVVAQKFYNYFYAIKGITHLRVNNYGYAPIDDEIAEYESDLQYGMQLYKELIKNHTGYMINEKCSVVEVGCGKGAGAEYVMRKFKPKNYTGIDYSETAIDFCTNTYQLIKNANFIRGDAHDLPLENNSVDVVLNIESSHIYKDQNKFFSEVHRILKNEGKFLITDYRYVKKTSVEQFEEEIAGCGFKVIDKKIITPQIYDACVLASDRRKKIIDGASPWYMKKYFGHYAALNGTKKQLQFGNGEIVYFIYHLEKK